MTTSFWSPLTIAKENFSSLAWAEAEAALLAVPITVELHLKLVIIEGKIHLHLSFFIGNFDYGILKVFLILFLENSNL